MGNILVLVIRQISFSFKLARSSIFGNFRKSFLKMEMSGRSMLAIWNTSTISPLSMLLLGDFSSLHQAAYCRCSLPSGRKTCLGNRWRVVDVLYQDAAAHYLVYLAGLSKLVSHMPLQHIIPLFEAALDGCHGLFRAHVQTFCNKSLFTLYLGEIFN
ncbi:hypothetical protein LN893_19390 [Pontibacter sp. XAAS-A31]|nr:hypothetical protein [Pontibacter harenae]MCC9169013.1 hypothetical protein [Pontibacter harenae]